MLCERCKKNEANYHYRENVNGTERVYHLCTDCAEALEKSGELKGQGKDLLADLFFGGNDLNTMFASLFAPSHKDIQGAQRAVEKTKCTLCGATFDELAREGKAGCPKCYEVFAEELEQSIIRIHGRTTHTGKEPVKYREKNENKRRIAKLEAELREAIKTENYERAAELRDEIKALRSLDDGNNGGKVDVV